MTSNQGEPGALAVPSDVTSMVPHLIARPHRLSLKEMRKGPGRCPLSESHDGAAYLSDTKDGYPIYVTQKGKFFTICQEMLIEASSPSAVEKRVTEHLQRIEGAVPAFTSQYLSGRGDQRRMGVTRCFITHIGGRYDHSPITEIGEELSLSTVYGFDSEAWEILGDLQKEWDAEDDRHEEAQKRLAERASAVLATLPEYTKAYHQSAQRVPIKAERTANNAAQEAEGLASSKANKAARARIMKHLVANQGTPQSVGEIAKAANAPELLVYDELDMVRKGNRRSEERNLWYQLVVYLPVGYSGRNHALAFTAAPGYAIRLVQKTWY